jgi:hypothetical protein
VPHLVLVVLEHLVGAADHLPEFFCVFQRKADWKHLVRFSVYHIFRRIPENSSYARSVLRKSLALLSQVLQSSRVKRIL